MLKALEGAAAEQIAAAHFLRAGYEVFWPCISISKADFVVVKGDLFQRVQVKKVTHEGKRRRVKCTPNGSRARQYGAKDYDLLAAVDGEKVLVFTRATIGNRANITVKVKG